MINEETGEVFENPVLGIFSTHSKEIDKIVPALIGAQAKMQAAPATSINEFYRKGNDPSRYADLAAVREASLSILTEHELAITQLPVTRPFMQFDSRQWKKNARGEWIEVISSVQCMADLVTMLSHSSGQWLMSKTPICCDWGDVQKVAGTITYLRRSTWSSIMGLAQQDDDGNTATGRRLPRQDDRQQQRPAQQPRRWTAGNGQGQQQAPAQQPAPQREPAGKRLFKWIQENDKYEEKDLMLDSAKAISKHFGYGERIEDLTNDQANAVYRELAKWIASQTPVPESQAQPPEAKS
jgi:hypothetical protein